MTADDPWQQQRLSPAPTNYCGSIFESNAGQTGVQLKMKAKLLTFIWVNH